MRCGRFVPLATIAWAALVGVALAVGLSPAAPAVQAGPADLESSAGLARPTDLLELVGGKSLAVQPLAADTLLDKQFPGKVVLHEIDDDDKVVQQREVTRAEVVQYVPFERHVLEEIARYEQANKELSPVARLSSIEKVLTAVLRFHLAVRDRALAGANRWADLQAELEHKLREVRRHWLRELVAAAHNQENWTAAVRLGDRMAQTYPSDQTMLEEVARLRTRWAGWILLHGGDKKLAGGDYTLVRQQLEWLEEHCQKMPQPEAEELQQLLAQKAAGLLKAARVTKDDQAAIRQLEEAMQIWPRLRGLYDELLKRQGEYTILYVGVRQLPVYLAPPLACTAAELQAVELLFEGLLQPRPGNKGQVFYVPQLAVGTGAKLDGGRSFSLVRYGYWCDGKRVTEADVQRSFQMLTNPALPGLPTRVAELADALDLQRVEDDLFRVDFHYRKGLLDPLAPFTFKILPRDLEADPAALEKFAHSPVGSGPYCLEGPIVKEHGRSYVVFKANPFYYGRPGRPVPQIREVRFFVSADPVADFGHKTAPLHLLLDVPQAAVGPLKKAGVKEIRTLERRRVYFLAVNCADKPLADVNLRRALAHGIDRDRLLAEHFRAAKRMSLGPANFVSGSSLLRAAMAVPGSNDHRTLNGPFPANTWPCCTDGRVPPAGKVFEAVRARKFLTDTMLQSVQLQLKYPNNDPRIAGACKAMAEDLAQLGTSAGCPITIELVPLSPHQLRGDLLTGDYQLAYWFHDFPNDTFSLWPLLDPRADDRKKVANYLGYSGDGTLTSLLIKASSHRDFHEVKKQMQELHDHLYMTMPLIPLWQLDMHMAVHPALTLPAVDPLRIFSNIEQWKLTKR